MTDKPQIQRRLAALTGLTWVQQASPVTELLGVAFDSRAAGPGDLYVALVGTQSDGHAYLEQALSRGVRAILVDREVDVPDNVDVFQTIDTRAELGSVSALVYGAPSRDLEVIGITGTNGKTTSTYLLEALARACGKTTGVIGTIEYRWPGALRAAANTTPESATLQEMFREMISAGVQTAVMEVSSHGLSSHRVNGTLFDVGIFTNFTQDHLDFHGDLDAYKSAKFSLFLDHFEGARRAGKNPIAVVNVDDSAGRELLELLSSTPTPVLGYGKSKSADIRWEIVDRTLDGSSIRVFAQGDCHEFMVPLLGDFNVENALGVWSAGLALGWDPALMKEAFDSNDVHVPGRLQSVGKNPTGFVDYAHTPDALERAMKTLKALTLGRLIVVFGCGGDRDRLKRPLMGQIARQIADVVVVTSDNPRTEDPRAIIEDIIIDGGKEHVVVDRGEAIRLAVELSQPEDVLLVAGKGHEDYQEIGEIRRNFDDVSHLAKALKERQ